MFGSKKKNLEKSIREIMDSWLTQNKRELDIVSDKAKSLETELGRIGDRIAQIEALKVKGSIANQIMFSPHFQADLNRAYQIAICEYAPLTMADMSPSMSTLKGEVTDRDFGTTIGPRQVITLFGLKTKYIGQDDGIYRIQIGDKLQKPFIVNNTTEEVIFFQSYYLREDEYFGIKRLQGNGKLKFQTLGVTISPNLFSIC